MKKLLTVTLALALAAAVLAGCAKSGGEGDASLTDQEWAELYTAAITGARAQEENEAYSIVTAAQDDMAQMYLEMLGLKEEDMQAFAVSASPMNVHAYTVALVMPAQGREQAVKDAMQAYIDQKQMEFEQYLADQYEIAKGARLETLEDGTVALVMCQDQDKVYESIQAALKEA